ncbi:hypothetical protein KBK19_04375 [Microvirga sp. STR05]|uniref:Type I restriction enzyme R protein N-terminal domain-containing protein n=1 Tax=Hymenobacter duratus TaxID=2771356 RepID=A0ABR8JFU3_9BACT|nr:hypothetical protein [Hymenobacter duratus]MBD2714265.1 hypothetical protein [Hymenobacter duratus]MBR7949168.1 hypothetical protein [Microvirga sp. STR05]
MSVTSPLASLYTVLQAVRTSAKLNAPLLRKNEAATRAALIDPVLRALGWDTTNVQMVEPEKTIGGDLRVDYLLHDVAGKPHIVIEAKCLDASLDKHGYVSKVLGYALGFKVQTVFITDGLSWHCYSNLHKGNTEAVTFSLVGDLLPAALHLIQWLDAAQSGYGIAHSSDYISQVAEVAPIAVAKSQKRKANKAQKADESTFPGFVELTHINTLHLEPNQKPKQLRLPNGTVKNIKSWKDILLEASQFFLQQSESIALPFPDKSGKKTALFSLQKALKGSSHPVSYQGKTLYVYTNYSAQSCLANALYVFSKLPPREKQQTSAVTF